jgi:Domain of Unknown Function (DUF1206)
VVSETATLRVLLRIRSSRSLDVAARAGLVVRGIFYLLLAVLVLALLLGRPVVRQANANGALSAVEDTHVGTALLVVAAVGFAAFGLLRVVGALTDHRPGRLRRLSTAGQGVLYLGLSLGTVAFLLGLHALGSEGEQSRTASTVLGLPGGRVWLVAVGLVFLCTCLWQLFVAASGGFADTLHTERMDHPLRWLTLLTGRLGIPARALSVAPVGVFLVVAGARGKANSARGLNAFLLDLVQAPWGRVLVVLVAAGFAVFATYSFLEAAFRQVSAGS